MYPDSLKEETYTYYKRDRYGDLIRVEHTTNGFIGSYNESKLVPYSKECKKANNIIKFKSSRAKGFNQIFSI